MRIAIATDAWNPQVSGVVRTLNQTIGILREWGHEVLCVNPTSFRTVPMPTYPDIGLAVMPGRKVRASLDEFRPEAIHIATEGPIGWAARRHCLRRDWSFTTAYHTRFPEYIRLRAPVPLSFSYALMRRFHHPATRVLVTTPSLCRALEQRGFRNLAFWSRGVDVDRFHPSSEAVLSDLPRPILMHLGRVAVEKNISDFLDLDLPGSKVVIGDGPARARLEAEYPQAHFLGYRENGDLVRHLATADVLVFPSRTDTFGLVMLEAMACGVPVAAYPVEGPVDVIENGVNGWLDEDLGYAARRALEVSAVSCRRFAEQHSWRQCTEQFLSQLQPV